MAEYVLALDFGGTFVKYALVDEEGHLWGKGKAPSPRGSEEDFLHCVKKALEASTQGGERVGGIAISLGGKLDPMTGRVVSSGQFPFFNERSITWVLSQATGLRVTVQNDAHAAAIAELAMGSLRGVQDALVIVLGTGIGGALVTGGKIYEGHDFRATELSLIRTDGNRDWHHSWIFSGGASGLVRLAQKHAGTDEELDGIEIFRRLEAGDAAMRAAVEEFCEVAAVQIYNLQAILDVEKVAIGGGISAQPLLFELINKNLDEIYAAESKYAFPPRRPEVVPCTFRNDSNLLGAWYDFCRRA